MTSKDLQTVALKICGCAAPIACSGIMCFGYPGVMNGYWREAFSASESELGAILTWMLLALAVMMFVSGKIHAKIGTARVFVVGTCFYLAALGIYTLARSMTGIYVASFVSNLGCSFLYGPGFTAAQRIWPERKGLVSGTLNLIFGSTPAAFAPILHSLLGRVGYPAVNALVASLFIASCVLSLAILRRVDLDAIPDAASGGGDAREHDATNAAMRRELTPAQALQARDFWMMWTIWATMGAAGIAMIYLAKSYSIAVGIAGVTVLAAFNLTNGLSRIVVGTLSDRIGARLTSALAYLLAAAGYFVMPHVPSPWTVGVCAMCVGVGFGALFTVSGPILANRFGLRNFGAIFGLVFTGYGLVGGLAGPAVAGLLLEKTGGNFTVVFSYLGVLALIGAILTMFLSRSAERESSRRTIRSDASAR